MGRTIIAALPTERQDRVESRYLSLKARSNACINPPNRHESRRHAQRASHPLTPLMIYRAARVPRLGLTVGLPRSALLSK